MMNKNITNNELSKYKKLLQKKYRYKYNEFIIEGKHLIDEASKYKGLLKKIITSDKYYKLNGFNVLYTTYDEICKLSTTKTPQAYIGICNFMEYKEDHSGMFLILDNINDPGNLGTLIRTGYSFGVKNIVVNGVDIYNPKVLRATQGSIFNTNIINVKNLEEYIVNLKNNDYKIIGSLLKDAKNYNDIEINSSKFALILGNEAHGIRKNIIKLLDYKVYIPIKFESLNVAIAGGILLSKYLK